MKPSADVWKDIQKNDRHGCSSLSLFLGATTFSIPLRYQKSIELSGKPVPKLILLFLWNFLQKTEKKTSDSSLSPDDILSRVSCMISMDFSESDTEDFTL